MTLSLKILWAVKILLALRKASEAGAPPMKSRELMAACLNPGADTYMYRRVLRELVAKTDYVTCIIQSGRTYYEWNRNLRPTLYDLTIRLEGGMHEVTNGQRIMLKILSTGGAYHVEFADFTYTVE